MGDVMNNDMEDNLDLLDLEEDTDLSVLPEVSPFANPRPKKPWLLMGIGLLVIILATYIIVRVVVSDSGSSIDVDLDTPEVVTVTIPGDQPDTLVVPTTPAAVPVQVPAPTPVVAPKPVAEPGVPVREVTDRKEVTFNPTAGTTAKKPAPLPIAKPVPTPVKSAVVKTGSWYVQFGSYSTRALAENAQKKIGSKHAGLFAGKQFVILAAVLPNGTTTYRLRIAFGSFNDANGFCRNAKSDGLECYVAK